MAYEGGIGGTFKTLWSPDLTTRAGALSAAQSASTALFVIAVGRAFLLWVSTGTALTGLIAQGHPVILLALAEIGLMLAAAVMLRKGRGVILAVVATLLYFLGLLVSGTILGWVVGAVMLGAMVGGVRGALALRRGKGFTDDVYETFG